MYKVWMFQAHFSSYTLQHKAARHTAHKTVHQVQNWKRTRSMEKQKHIYSDLHEFSPLFTRAQPLSLFQIK